MYTLLFKIETSGEIRPREQKVMAERGENLLDIMQRENIVIDAPCSGNGTCGKCRIRLTSGHVEMIKNPHLSEEDYNDGWRLACQAVVAGDATIWVPSEAAAFKNDIKTADLSSREELERYESAIGKIFEAGLERVYDKLDITVLPEGAGSADMPEGNSELRTIDVNTIADEASGDGKTSASCNMACHNGAVTDSRVGIAIDIGTTTVTGAMINLASGKILAKASMGNGQIRYGADVINRIIRQSKEGGVEKLRAAVREETILPMVRTMLENSGLQESDIVRYVIAGNTTMEHLFLGADGQSIRLEPFVPEFLEREGDTIASCGLIGSADGEVIFAPNVGSYVGGDITAGALDSMLWNSPEMTLFIDLGTNGELVFGNSDYMLTCACSAGPAFEGGDISCGMRATNGAIDSARLDDGTFEPHYTIIGASSDGLGGRSGATDSDDDCKTNAAKEKACTNNDAVSYNNAGKPEQKPVIRPAGLCGSGLISIISELFRTGAISAKGKFAGKGCHVSADGTYDSTSRIRYDEYGQGCYVVAFAAESADGSELTLNESDLDNFIRAKGAIFSAIQTMLKGVDMDTDCIDRVIIAGGIGSGIDIEKAISIGMLPKLPLEKYSYIGNSSLTGACAMLLSDRVKDKVLDIAHNMTYLELSTYPGYMDELVAACFIPHTDATLFD